MDYDEYDAIVSRRAAMQRVIAREWDENERRLLLRDLERLADDYDVARCRLSQVQTLLNDGAAHTYLWRALQHASTS